MTTTRKGAAPGSNNGGGRKKSERKLVRRNVMLYEDQAKFSSEQIRAFIDECSFRMIVTKKQPNP